MWGGKKKVRKWRRLSKFVYPDPMLSRLSLLSMVTSVRAEQRWTFIDGSKPFHQIHLAWRDQSSFHIKSALNIDCRPYTPTYALNVPNMPPVARDIYKNDVDFTALALQYPDFAKKWVVESKPESRPTVLTHATD